MYFDSGIPEGHHYTQRELILEPKLISVTPNSGSIGGTLVTAVVPGAGPSTDLVDSNGDSICESVSLKSYGVLECKTLPQVIATTELSVVDGNTIYECANTDTSQCQYEQLEGAGFPDVASTSV